ncbi:MAG: YHYH protein [Burkholderiales bacterium]|nr:YHYH protein [Burkholderiales bacterium]
MSKEVQSTRRTLLFAGPAAAAALAGCGGSGAVADANAAGTTLVNRVTWFTSGDKRIVQTNQVPDHDNVGPFPDFADPHELREVPKELRMPVAPVTLAQSQAIDQSRFGVARNRILLDPAGPLWKNEYKAGWQFEVMSERIRHYIGIDASNGHTQTGGAYHHHGSSERYMKKLARERVKDRLPGVDSLLLIGWAADGYPIHWLFVPDTAAGSPALERELKSSYRLKAGLRPAGAPRGAHDGTFVRDYEYVAGLGDLDKCNGMQLEATPEFRNGTYAYFVTRDFPHIPRKWRVQPDQTFFVALGSVGADDAPPQYADWPTA